MSKRVKKELGSSPAVTRLWWDFVGEGEETETEVWEPSKCQWSQSQRKALSKKNECNACFDRESGESVSWTWTSKAFLRVNSIQLAFCFVLNTDGPGGRMQDKRRGSFHRFYITSLPLPWGGLGHQRPGQISGVAELASHLLLCCQPTGSQVRRTSLAGTVVHSRQETSRKGKRRQICDSGDT